MRRDFLSRSAKPLKYRRLLLENLEARRLMHAGHHAEPAILAQEVDHDHHQADLTPSLDSQDDQEFIRYQHPVSLSMELGPESAVSGGLTSSSVMAAASPLAAIPGLNSLVGAAASLYLDFDGHFEAAWGPDRNITSPAYDTDGDASTFTDSELASIRRIWEYVAEDFAIFNINVPTVLPPSFANAGFDDGGS